MRVFVRDDGSKDSTPQILDDYATRFDKFRLIKGNNIGVLRSFDELMNKADPDCELFMFCDQDDVWLPNKVSAAAKRMESAGSSDSPVLYCSRSMVTDEGLHRIGLTDYYPEPSFRQALVQGVAPGHTMMCNAALLKLGRNCFPVDQIIMHDFWLFLIAAGLGEVIFDPNYYSLYRIHSNNTLGYSSNLGRRMLSNIRSLFDFDFKIYARQAAAFERCFGSALRPDDQAALSGFVRQGNIFNRIRYVRHFGINYGGRVGALAGAVLFILGRYKR